MASASPSTAKSGHGVIFKRREEVFIVRSGRGEQGKEWHTPGRQCPVPSIMVSSMGSHGQSWVDGKETHLGARDPRGGAERQGPSPWP